MSLREDAQSIITYAIKEVLPDQAVADALKTLSPNMEKIYLVAVGKAAWQMAKAASDLLGSRIEKGICITKYGHIQGKLPGISCYEAGHPVPDTNTYEATQKVLDFIKGLEQDANILFLLSGGGSALFEKPLIPPQELEEITRHLLSCGADISEINTIRKRFSAVKGGKFAKLCEPRQMYCIILSDVLGDAPEIIASGPACADPGTGEQAEEIIKKYHLVLSEAAREQLHTETPKVLTNVSLQITGSVRELCIAAAGKCEELGYETTILTDCLDCEAREAGRFLSAIARSHQNTEKSGFCCRRGNCCTSDRKRKRRAKSGACPSRSSRNHRSGRDRHIKRRQRWNRRSHRRSGRLLRWNNCRKTWRARNFHSSGFKGK